MSKTDEMVWLIWKTVSCIGIFVIRVNFKRGHSDYLRRKRKAHAPDTILE